MAKELVKPNKAVEVIPFSEVPDHLRNIEGSGLDGMLNTQDLKIPRIKLLKPLNPEIVTFGGEAKPNHFWHTGVYRDLGTEVRAVVCHINKRVAVWLPRDNGGGLAAMSRDGVHWSQGANQKVHIKVGEKTVVWDTKGSVKESGLLKWGSFNPGDEDSAPAAQLTYDYMLYLVDYPELSPVLMGVYRTALANGRQLNTALLGLKKPIYSAIVRVFVEEKSNSFGKWPVPAFQMKGWAPADLMGKCKELADMASQYGDAEVDEEEARVDSDRY